MCIHQLTIVQGLANDAPHKTEEIQMIGAPDLIVLHHTVGVGLKGGPCFWDGYKEGKVGVEDFASHHLCKGVCIGGGCKGV